MREAGGCKADRWLSLVAVVAAALVATGCAAVAAQERPSSDNPNFVFVLTNDQTANTLPHNPAVRQNLVTWGTTFKNFVLTLPTCCPSRATFLRGRYAHNHGIVVVRRGRRGRAGVRGRRPGQEHRGDLA